MHHLPSHLLDEVLQPSTTASSEGPVMSGFIELPDLNLEKVEPSEDEGPSSLIKRRRRDSKTPEIDLVTVIANPKRRKIREDSILVEYSPSEKIKGKQPAKQEPDYSEPAPDVSSYPASPPQRQATPPATEPLSAYTCPICFGPPTYATLTPWYVTLYIDIQMLISSAKRSRLLRRVPFRSYKHCDSACKAYRSYKWGRSKVCGHTTIQICNTLSPFYADVPCVEQRYPDGMVKVVVLLA
jgi:hypothetical protein